MSRRSDTTPRKVNAFATKIVKTAEGASLLKTAGFIPWNDAKGQRNMTGVEMYVDNVGLVIGVTEGVAPRLLSDSGQSTVSQNQPTAKQAASRQVDNEFLQDIVNRWQDYEDAKSKRQKTTEIIQDISDYMSELQKQLENSLEPEIPENTPENTDEEDSSEEEELTEENAEEDDSDDVEEDDNFDLSDEELENMENENMENEEFDLEEK